MVRQDENDNKQHTSIIMWRGKVFEFAEPVNEEKLKAFFNNNKQAPYFSWQQHTDLQNMKVQVFFHGAGDSPQNYTNVSNIYSSECDDSTIYYFPNNQMREPTGVFDRLVGERISYPSKKDAQENGEDATKTLTTICHHICKNLQVKNVIPNFKGTSAGVNTMLSCLNSFLDKCKKDDDLRKSVYILRKNVEMQQIPIAGYKGAKPEESAQLLSKIENNLSILHSQQDAERLRDVYNIVDINTSNDDRYMLDVYDDVSFLRFLRLHSVNNTKRFLKYLNDNSMSVPMEIVCYKSSPSFTKEKKMLTEIQNGKYKNMPNVQLCICQNNGVQSVIFNSLKNKYPLVSDTKVLPSCLDFAYETLFSKKHDTSMRNRNTKFDLKKAFHRKKEKNR